MKVTESTAEADEFIHFVVSDLLAEWMFQPNDVEIRPVVVWCFCLFYKIVSVNKCDSDSLSTDHWKLSHFLFHISQFSNVFLE